jgi:polyhydroxyalkanoate synthesis regulator phasin
MVTQKHEQHEQRSGQLLDATRTILLAAIGAASLAKDELNRFVDRLVERGELAESDARRLVREVLDRREQLERERKAKPDHSGEGVSKAELEALNARIADLTRQIEELKQAKAG